MPLVTVCSATLGEDGKREPPLGPLYIAGAFQEAGLDVDFRDFQLCHGANAWSPHLLASFLQGHSEITAISSFVDMLPCVIMATRLIKQRNPDTTIILGGPGPSRCAVEILERFPWIDAVVSGEGEETVREWVSCRQNRQDTRPIAGMAYRRDGNIISGSIRPRVSNLSTLPKPAYDLVNWPDYSQARIITTRGCAYKCSFCDVTALWGNRSVYVDVEDAVTEIESLRDRFGMTQIGVVDDTFVQNRKRVIEFCELLIHRQVGVEWGCFGRINLMSPELVELMAAAGCRAVFYGIDSGSQEILDRVHKVLKAEQICSTVEYSAKAFDKVEASFIWGYPFETLDDFRVTLDIAADISMLAPRVNVQMHMLSPLPNSPIYGTFRGQLREPEIEDRPWLLLPALLLEPEAKPLHDIVRSHPDLFPGFYTFPTPAKVSKRKLLTKAMNALNRTVGKTLLDSRIATLVSQGDRAIELELLGTAKTASDRIGIGLAIGFLRRSRRRRGLENRNVFDGMRSAQFVRERNDQFI